MTSHCRSGRVLTTCVYTYECGTPLPPLESLQEHPVGVREGKRVCLCSESHLIASRKIYVTIEVSEEFSEHYDERVYVVTL